MAVTTNDSAFPVILLPQGKEGNRFESVSHLTIACLPSQFWTNEQQRTEKQRVKRRFGQRNTSDHHEQYRFHRQVVRHESEHRKGTSRKKNCIEYDAEMN